MTVRELIEALAKLDMYDKEVHMLINDGPEATIDNVYILPYYKWYVLLEGDRL